MTRARFLPGFLIGILFFAGAAYAQSEGQVLRVGETDLHFMREGQGRPIVMIHGSYSSLTAYQMSIFEDVAKKYDAVAFDLPGFGKSSRPKKYFPLGERVSLIRDAVKKLGLEKPVLVGHSSGAAFVLRYAMDYPDDVSALVLLAPYVEEYEKSHLFYRVLTTPIAGDIFFYGFLKPIQWFKDDQVFLKRSFSPAEPDKEYADIEVALTARRSSFKANAWDIQNLGPELITMSGRYDEIKAPVTILAGEADVVAKFDKNAKILQPRIPGSELILLPETGHVPMFTHPEKVLGAIDQAAAVSK